MAVIQTAGVFLWIKRATSGYSNYKILIIPTVLKCVDFMFNPLYILQINLILFEFLSRDVEGLGPMKHWQRVFTFVKILC